jgi:hypothetical protein
MEHFNPILEQGFVVGGQTRQLTCTETPLPASPKRPPAAVQKLISELGFRYRPTSQTDLEAHAAALALLACDLAEMPAGILDKAIKQWAIKSPFLPKASDLIALGKAIVNPPRTGGASKEIPASELARKRNESGDMPDGIIWRSDDRGGLWLEEYR